MKFTPYPHQQAGIDWILRHPACALLWGMGTGKTVTTLTAVDRLLFDDCLLYTSPSPRDWSLSRMPSSA